MRYLLFQYLRIKNFYYQLYIMLLLGLYLVCWLSCLCYLIPILVMYLSNFPPEVREYFDYMNHIANRIMRVEFERCHSEFLITIRKKECKDCWMIRLKDSSLTFKFKNALLIVLQNILGNGYGLLIPETNSDIILTSILMVIGRCIVCYILSKSLYDILFLSYLLYIYLYNYTIYILLLNFRNRDNMLYMSFSYIIPYQSYRKSITIEILRSIESVRGIRKEKAIFAVYEETSLSLLSSSFQEQLLSRK